MAADPPLMLMDEPFGAIDPITRERLQNDFLRLHREVRKTVIFVTHDIDEAIKMGDRICILRQGGKLAQFDTPEEILADPADEFVADFVGADRGLKRLVAAPPRRARAARRTPAPTARAPGGRAADTTLRDALSADAHRGRRRLVVRDDDGGVKGHLTLEARQPPARRTRRGRAMSAAARRSRRSRRAARSSRTSSAATTASRDERQVLPALVPRQLRHRASCRARSSTSS